MLPLRHRRSRERIPASVPAQTAPASVYVPTSLAAEPGLPRTPDGHPDFQDVVWNANFFAYLQGGTSPETVLPEAKAKELFGKVFAVFEKNPLFKIELPLDPVDGFPIVRGERRTRLLVLPADGKMPFTADARKELAVPLSMTLKADNPEERSHLERCLAGGERRRGPRCSHLVRANSSRRQATS